MDIFFHAATGVAMGGAFGHPIAGALYAVLPDLVLMPKRIEKPTDAYTFTHSLLFVALTVGAAWTAGIDHWHVIAIALLSHIGLDLFTHGSTWAPALFYPFSNRRFAIAGEWEFFNIWWCIGALASSIWIMLWAMYW